MNVEKAVAGVFVGAGSLLLIYKGELAPATGLLGGLLGFFVGDTNGFKNGVKSVEVRKNGV